MPLDMDVNAIRCTNERRQRRNGPFGTKRNPTNHITPSRNAINLWKYGSTLLNQLNVCSPPY
eukprot:4426573-Lingulodinium_polyedra.AAC.1